MLGSETVRIAAIAVLLAAALAPRAFAADGPDLTHATIVTRDKGAAPAVELTAATVLAEEVAKRSGVKWTVATEWPAEGWAIAVVSGKVAELHGRQVPAAAVITKAEGYGIATDTSNQRQPVLWVVGADPRGAIFGVGRVLRELDCRRGSVRLVAPLNLTTSPAYEIRGHQLGYRATANSYDAWSPEQFDQYIREMALFGTNAVEGIPFQDTRPTVNSYPRSKMNVDISRICQRYGLDYWIWAPADFDLKDTAKRAKALEEHETLFRECPVMSDVFVAGGDPGDNPPELVIPYLQDLAKILAKYHPEGRIWLSMQGYSGFEQDYVYRWIKQERPKWLGGLVCGPSSPPIPEVRARLPKEYKVRDYPDITHSVRCQFPVLYWDPAFAFTLGRECINPRPLFFQRIIRDTAPFTNGFSSYSEGVNDDVNKIVWSALEWDPSADITTVLRQYCRVYFNQDVADAAADGIFGLERDFDGALATNGTVAATFGLWRRLEREHPELKGNWRWQMCLLRAYYDMYTRERLIYETGLENEADADMLQAPAIGSDKAIDEAVATLKRATTEPVRKDLSARVAELCDELWHSIGLQTSVDKYHAAGSERGAVLDFLNYPLNNRWWLEDEMAKVKAIPSESEKVARLATLATWAHPGPGSFYDDVGNVGMSPHEVRNEQMAEPILDMDNAMTASFMMWTGNNPLARVRQSWISYEDWPKAFVYTALDPHADYVVRTTGCGDCFLRVNGVRLVPTIYGKNVGDIKEFPMPRGLYRDGKITVTFDPTFEPQLNWRVQSRLCEIWLIKK